MVMSLAFVLLLSLLLALSNGLMYDVISPKLLAPSNCAKGCAVWTKDQPGDVVKTDAWWSSGEGPPATAANHCAQLANSTGLNKPAPVLDPKGVGGQGAWCFCEGSDRKEWGYCSSPSFVPEQVNLQLAAPDTVVVSFVTFEPSAPAGLPVAELTEEGTEAEGGVGAQLTGVTHTYVTPSGNRTYYMHFVKFAALKPRTKYSYRVRSGSSACAWSDSFTFRSPYDSSDGKPTRVAIFGDMGVYR